MPPRVRRQTATDSDDVGELPQRSVLTQRLTDFGSSSRSVGRSAAGALWHSPGDRVVTS